jgi:uncharacterized membrane protein YeaQ/YmgE (transglycosylase-associated protein family)
MITFIVVLLIIGFIVGLVARALVPGRDHIGILGTIALGIVGSFIGGFVDSFVQYHELAFHPSGIIWSIVGAIILLVLLRVTGMEPGHGRRRR